MTLAVGDPRRAPCDVDDVRIVFRDHARVGHLVRLAPAGSTGTPP